MDATEIADALGQLGTLTVYDAAGKIGDMGQAIQVLVLPAAGAEEVLAKVEAQDRRQRERDVRARRGEDPASILSLTEA